MTIMYQLFRMVCGVVLFAVAWLLPCNASAAVANPMSIALEIKVAIMNSDAAMLSGHLKNASYFIDEPYTKQELISLFQEKDSWLQRNLFVGAYSVKAYFAEAKDLKIVLMQFEDEDIISYQSSNSPPHLWPWCSIRPEGNSWVFSDMFAYR